MIYRGTDSIACSLDYARLRRTICSTRWYPFFCEEVEAAFEFLETKGIFRKKKRELKLRAFLKIIFFKEFVYTGTIQLYKQIPIEQNC